jgi:Do/DeqQ family serine protease
MKRRTALFAGLGLVLVGLLAGILGTLWLSNAAQPAQQFVRRVELNASSLPGNAASGSTAAVQARAAEAGASPRSGGRDGSAPGSTAAPTGRLGERFERVADQVRPSVVYLQIASGQQALPSKGGFPGGGDDGSGERRRFFGPRESVGSGVIISPGGYIVTNNHVVRDAERITVNLADKRKFEAEVVGADPSTDLAVLKAQGAANLPALPLGNSDEVDVGEWVLAVGNPFRLTSTVTAGIVSALGRQVGIIKNRFGIEHFIQTDAAINPGNSGGALVNLRGELVGLSTAIASEGGSYEGYGFAVPSSLVQRVTRDLIEHGEVERPLLGVRIGNVDAQMARRLGLDDVAGAYVSDVKSGGAADRAGLQSGDVVRAVGERDVKAANDLQSAVARRRPGDTVQVRIWRDGATRVLAVELLGRDASVYSSWMNSGDNSSTPPPAPGGQSAPPAPGDDGDGEGGAAPQVFELEGWGLGLRALTQQERDAFEHPKGGVFVAFVADDGSAAQAGVPRNAVLTAVSGAAVGSVKGALRALRAASAQGAPALLRLKRRDGTSAFYEVAPPR